jgi:nicotinate-nucleotide pyrophosphorylase (carboxylating)
MPQASWTPDFNSLAASFEAAIAEDIGDGDHSALSCLDHEQRGKAKLIVKEPGIIAGIALAKHLFQTIDPTSSIEIFIEDGAEVQPGDIAFHIKANAIKL